MSVRPIEGATPPYAFGTVVLARARAASAKRWKLVTDHRRGTK